MGINLVIFPFTPRPQFLHTILFGPWGTQKSQNAPATGTMVPWAPHALEPLFQHFSTFRIFHETMLITDFLPHYEKCNPCYSG